MIKQVLLNFDLEEFDIPEEYGQKVDPAAKIQVSSMGLTKILGLLDKLNIPATFFTTVYFAKNQPSLIQQLIEKHELASHSISHSSFEKSDLLNSRLELEKLSGKKITGFRQPRFESADSKMISSAGYTYSSSENPIWLPGRYMHLFKPRLPYFSENLLNLPISTSPIIRYPLFWLSFKNSPLWLYKGMSLWALNRDAYLNIFFHPWEFVDLGQWQLPAFIKHLSGDMMLAKLETYLTWLKKIGAEFITCSEFADNFNALEGRKL